MLKKTFLALSVSPLAAQGFSGGLHLNGVVALGPLNTDEAGGTHKAFAFNLGGGHVAYAFDARNELVLGFNAANWKGSRTSPLPGLYLTNDYTFHQVGLDWRHRYANAPQFGCVGGLSLATRVERNLSVEPSVALGSFGSTDITTQSNRPGVKVGTFFRPVSWFSLEGSLNHVWLKKRPGTADRLDSASWLQVSAIFHFGTK